MNFKHHDMEFELSDDWWHEAQMDDFLPAANCYRVNADAFPDQRLYEVRIEDVGPVRRNLSVGVFNDNDVASARERVVSILRGFRSGVGRVRSGAPGIRSSNARRRSQAAIPCSDFQ
jgi:hypothetical protein